MPGLTSATGATTRRPIFSSCWKFLRATIPARSQACLTRRVFTYANVPYRIKPYSALLEDPRNTIDFDAALDGEIHQRVAAMGADGKALPGPDGSPYRVNLAEKLLVLVLARLFNFIPEAGLWMNTQRPEWNDANNALVGFGVSMVTLYFLRRFLSLLPGHIRRGHTCHRGLSGGCRGFSPCAGSAGTPREPARRTDLRPGPQECS